MTNLPLSRRDKPRYVPLEYAVELLQRVRQKIVDKGSDPKALDAADKAIAAAEAARDAVAADERTAFACRVPTRLERAQWRREVRGNGANYPGDADLLTALRERIEEMEPDNLDYVTELLDRVEAVGIANLQGQDAKDFSELCRLVRALGGKFAGMEADRDFWATVATDTAVRHFLVGWTNRDGKVQLRANRVTDATMEQLGEGEVTALGFWIIQNLLSVPETERKNLSSPSPSLPAPLPSQTE